MSETPEHPLTDQPDTERGAVLMWVAGSLVALLAFAALAVDLGWYYVQSSRLQRAADAAALAGVVHVPGFLTNAETDARVASELNGFKTTGVGSNATLAANLVDDDKYTVQIDSTVDLFFAPVIGWDTLPLQAKSTAQYIKPVPLGSPFNTFGNGNDASQNFWAAIQGPYTAKEHGDPYAVECFTADSGGCVTGPNPDHRPGGYYYAVEVPAGKTSMNVDLYDAGFYDRSGFAETGDEESLTNSDDGGADTHFQLYLPDSTPLDPTDNTAIGSCSATIPSESNSGTYRNTWAQLCSSDIANPTPGIYVLRVWTTGNDGGSNHYSIRVTTSGAQDARVYGINDISIFTNDIDGDGTATLYLAEILEVHAGKRLELRFYDPGEGSGNAYMRVRMPNGVIPTCNWFAEDQSGTTTATGSGSCAIQTTVSGTARFNGQWVTANIDIPDAASYNCAPNCWWTMELELNRPHDRTTWQATVIGNPVRLVPNP